MMNTYSQHKYNKMYNQNIPWNRNIRPQFHNTQRRYNMNSPWSSHTSPGSEKYWCETCDKGFMTQNHLDYHKQQHQKCNIDGCEFVAHPKIITKHIQMQHATGLYKRIGKLNNPEEIKKWREERKRKYPTKENIEKKQAEIKEKIKRGEKMGLKHTKHGVNKAKSGPHNRNQNNTHGKHIKTFNKRKIASQLSNDKPTKNHIHKIVLPEEEPRKLQPFKGIQDIVFDKVVKDETSEEDNDLIEDEEDLPNTDIQDKETIANPIVCGALTSLMCNYESTDEEDIEDNTKTISIKRTNTLNNGNTIQNPKTTINVNKDVNASIECSQSPSSNVATSNNKNKSTCHVESENESGPEETKIIKNEPAVNNDSKPKCIPSRKEIKRHEYVSKNKHRHVNSKRKLPSTLLEKLLHREIQHERNVILQCIRYVVKNKYFDKI